MVIARRIYERFGSYLLFKKLETDALGDLFRAGRIEGDAITAVVALRRLSGGDRNAIRAAVEQAKLVAPLLTGTTIVKNQLIETIDGIPVIVHEYVGGRSLRHIIDKGKGAQSHPGNPLPTDQAVAITEKLALSLEMIGNLKYQGARLLHGGLLPQFIWIAEDGEVRTSGQQIGSGLIASLRDPNVARQIGGFFAPEVRSAAAPTKSSEIYSLGAILYLCVTGENPPDPTDREAFEKTIADARLNGTDAPLPDDIRMIIGRTLALDPAKRFAAASDVRSALGNLVHGGKYAPTTFNLAFYLSTLLKKELESEAADRDRESKVNVATYLDAPDEGTEPAAPSAPMFGASIEQKKSRAGLIAAIVAGIVIIGGGAFYFFNSQKTSPKKPATAVAAPKAAPTAGMASAAMTTPIIATTSTAPAAATATTTAAATSTAASPELRKKAIEDEVNRRLQEEMIKLQQAYDEQLKKEKKLPAAPAAAPTSAPMQTQPAQPVRVAENKPSPSAAELDERRRAQTQTAQPAPPVLQPAAQPPQQQASAPPPAPAVPEVHEGDLVELSEVDSAPRLLSQIRPTYPPMAERARLEGSVILSVLVSETGRVLDVKVLRGDSKMGFDDAAVRAIRGASFAPATKSGKHVRTWTPIPIRFKL